MEWKKVSPELRALLEGNMESFKCEKRAMFGAPTYFINNNMFAGIHGDTVIIRLSESDREEILTTYRNARPFEPVKGRFMKEYIALPESVYSDRGVLQKWLRRSFTYASSLPAKARKKKSK